MHVGCRPSFRVLTDVHLKAVPSQLRAAWWALGFRRAHSVPDLFPVA